jgi:GNAT superfamily N-acetyltransferase
MELQRDNAEGGLETRINPYWHDGKPFIHLDSIRTKRDAPSGTGTAWLEKLCRFADRYGITITMSLGSPGDRDKTWKTTSSTERLRRFYRRFGFNANAKKGRYDLRGSWHRSPVTKVSRINTVR